MELQAASTAVIAVHLQGDIVSADGAFGDFFAAAAASRDVVGVNNALIADVRAAGGTVIYTRVAFRPDFSDLVVNSPLLGLVAQTKCLVDGSEKAEILPEMTFADGDFVVTHQRLGGFSDSGLDLLLRSRGITTVLLTGVATNMSVESTARQASDLGYRTVVVSDACSASDDDTHLAALNSLGLLGEVVTSADVREALHVAEATSTA
ncbi:cysteine hydrolase family protein [Rhodococcus koreensis]|uniref:cysteine hydrolase family protein n=1 Tax=Rhodococcus koreensis TaxID=99653 RepID=UPI00197F13FF|nr:cysteine hydrolase [Rhodococcus koreensis]QSE86346.1 cysteine hydrolase [Rhodococcus koreensis]